MKRLIASNDIWHNFAKESICKLSTSYDQLAHEQVLHMRVNNSSGRYLSWEEHLNEISLIYVTWSFSIEESQNFSWDIDEWIQCYSKYLQVLLGMFWYPTCIGSDKVSDQVLRYQNGLCALPLWSNHFRGTRVIWVTPKLFIEDHVWFEDWWMVASLCDEWLTTLCGLILG
jgi:hypothetical protein